MIFESEIRRLRRFNRVVTSELGAMDQSFLGRGRPLGLARVLQAIGQGKEELRDLRSYLGLDSGLLSRHLRVLEAEELVVAAPSQTQDARQKRVTLTDAGRREFDAYEALSDQHAQELLGRSRKRKELLAAIDLVSATFGSRQPRIRRAAPTEPDVTYAMAEYTSELSDRFGRSFAVPEMSEAERQDFVPPRGVFLLAVQDNMAIASGGLRPIDQNCAEVKRVWVNPAWRGQGVSRDMMRSLEDEARELGYASVRLDTSRHLQEAVSLYHALGYREIARYNDNPDADHFFEKML